MHLELQFKLLELMERSNFKNLTGERFGKLVVLEFAGVLNRQARWICQCDCGQITKPIRGYSLRHSTESCGCLAVNGLIDRSKTHGLSNTREYHIWKGMKSRCDNSNVPNYDKYGERGITYALEWLSFETFYRDMGPRPSPKHSLERKDNDGNYCKENCKWATAKEQTNNQTSNHVLDYDGLSLTLAQWGELICVLPCTLSKRLTYGWPIDRVLQEYKTKSKD